MGRMILSLNGNQHEWEWGFPGPLIGGERTPESGLRRADAGERTRARSPDAGRRARYARRRVVWMAWCSVPLGSML